MPPKNFTATLLLVGSLAVGCTGVDGSAADASADTGAGPADDVEQEVAESEPAPEPTYEDAAHTDWPMVDLIADLGGDGWAQGWTDKVYLVRSYVSGETDAADDDLVYANDADHTAMLALFRLWAEEVGFGGRVATIWYPDGQAEAQVGDEMPAADAERHVVVSRIDVPLAESEVITDLIDEEHPDLKAAADAATDALNEQRVADGKEAFLGWSDPETVEPASAPHLGLPEATISSHEHSSGRHGVEVAFRIAPYAFQVMLVEHGAEEQVQADAVALARKQYEHAAALLAAPRPGNTIDDELFTDVDTVINASNIWWWYDRDTDLDAYVTRGGYDSDDSWVRLHEAAGTRRVTTLWYADAEDFEDATTHGRVELVEADDPSRILDLVVAVPEGWMDVQPADVPVRTGVDTYAISGQVPGDSRPHQVHASFVAGDVAVDVQTQSAESADAAWRLARQIASGVGSHVRPAG